MSEPKKLQIQVEGAPNVGQPPQVNNPGTVSAADTMGGPMPPEPTKRKGLPVADEPWLLEHDMVVMGRLGRAGEGVPGRACRGGRAGEGVPGRACRPRCCGGSCRGSRA